MLNGLRSLEKLLETRKPVCYNSEKTEGCVMILCIDDAPCKAG